MDSISFLLRVTGQGTYDKGHVAVDMQFRHQPKQKAVVLSELPKEPPSLPRSGISMLEAVRERGRLRMGYISRAPCRIAS